MCDFVTTLVRAQEGHLEARPRVQMLPGFAQLAGKGSVGSGNVSLIDEPLMNLQWLRSVVRGTLVGGAMVILPGACAAPLVAGAGDLSAIERLRRHVSTLAADSLAGRSAGFAGEAAAAHYLAEQFRRLGLEALKDSAGTPTYVQEFYFVPEQAPLHHASRNRSKLRTQNVLGLLRGADPQHRELVVVLAAHHDGQGTTGQGSDHMRQHAGAGLETDTIWNSADDNATGVAVVLEVAARLAARTSRPAASILFASFSAEEHRWLADSTPPRSGGAGSEYYARHPAIPLKNHVAILDLEMLGRNPAVDPVLIVPPYPAFARAARFATEATGLEVRLLSPEPLATPDSSFADPVRLGIDPQLVSAAYQCCDHVTLHRRGIPAGILGVAGSRDHYHRSDDEAEQIAYDRLAQIARWVEVFITELAVSPASYWESTPYEAHNIP